MLFKAKTATLLMLGLAAASFSAASKTNWSDYSITYLNGSNYEVGDKDREVFTLEYASGTSWGDHFMFFDRLESDNGDVETYGELAPRIRFSDADMGLFKNIYFAPSVEFGPATNWLWGVGTDLNLSVFQYAKLSAYYKDHEDGDSAAQLTFSWGLPFGDNWLYDGFIDIVSKYDLDNGYTAEAQMNFTSQLKYNLGKPMGLDTPLYVGVEYVYWVNKFGIEGVDEKNLNLLVKYHF